MKKIKEYDASSIKTLEWYEHIQQRTGVYMPDKYEAGINHLCKETFQNSLDEANEGYGDRIDMTIDKDSFSCRDYGRGIPIEKVISVFTEMNTSGKFDADSYSIGVVGMNGMGNKIVNALSSLTLVNVYKDGTNFEFQFSYGKFMTQMNSPTNEKNGTRVQFTPDKKLLGAKKIDIELLEETVKTISLLFPNVTFKVNEKVYKSNGLIDFVSSAVNPLFKPLSIKEEIEGVQVEVHFTYVKDTDVQLIRSFANNVETLDEGTHVVGMKLGFGNIKKIVEDSKMKMSANIIAEDFRSGLFSVVSIKMSNNIIHFIGQGKTKLGNTEIQGHLQKVLNANLPKIITPTILKQILNNAEITAKARLAFKKSKEIKIAKNENKFSVMSNLDKFRDAKSNDVNKRELFIVEG